MPEYTFRNLSIKVLPAGEGPAQAPHPNCPQCSVLVSNCPPGTFCLQPTLCANPTLCASPTVCGHCSQFVSVCADCSVQVTCHCSVVASVCQQCSTFASVCAACSVQVSCHCSVIASVCQQCSRFASVCADCSVVASICQLGSCPGGSCPGGSCPGGSCPGGSCPGGSCGISDTTPIGELTDRVRELPMAAEQKRAELELLRQQLRVALDKADQVEAELAGAGRPQSVEEIDQLREQLLGAVAELDEQKGRLQGDQGPSSG